MITCGINLYEALGSKIQYLSSGTWPQIMPIIMASDNNHRSHQIEKTCESGWKRFWTSIFPFARRNLAILACDIIDSKPTINVQLAANFVDVWTLKRGNLPGLTCCQAEDLLNRKSELYERIDLILTQQEPLKVKSIKVIGDKSSTKTRRGKNGLWFSDHAAVAAKLKL